jgi:hypothetical protein
MRKIIFLLISVVMLNVSSTEACECQRYDNSFMYLLESKNVFLATVTEVEECGENNKISHQAFVEKNYKGKLDFRTTLYSDCITSCSFQLEKGERYLIFSDLNNGNIDFCDYIIPFSDSTFMLIKSYLDEIAYVRLDYLELFETADKSGYKAKLTILNGEVNGVVNLFDEAGNTVLKGIVNNGQMQGYYEIRTFGTTEDEIWTGNYKNGKRTGDWVYKAIAKDGTQKVNRYILYQYEAGEVVKEADLSMEAQLKKYEPVKDKQK